VAALPCHAIRCNRREEGKAKKSTLATKRRDDARTDKPALALKMPEAVKGTAAQAKYLLFGSWFSSPKFVLSVKNLGYDVAARLKNHENRG